MLTVRAKLDLTPLKEFAEFPDQLDFGISLGMNWCAKLAVADARAALPRHFTVRTKYTAGGIRLVKVAKKRDLTVEVGSISDYLRAQVEGGPRPEGTQRISAAPVAMRANAETKLSSWQQWPMALIRRGLAYRPGVDGKWKGWPDKRVRGAIAPLEPGQLVLAAKKFDQFNYGELLYKVEDDRTMKLPARFPLDAIVSATFTREFAGQLRRAMERAKATRR